MTSRRSFLSTAALGSLGLLAPPDAPSTCMGRKPEPAGKKPIGYIFLIRREGLDVWKDAGSFDPLILRTNNRYGDEHVAIFNAAQPLDFSSIPCGYQRYDRDEHDCICLTEQYRNAPYEAVIILEPQEHTEPVSFQGPVHWKNTTS